MIPLAIPLILSTTCYAAIFRGAICSNSAGLGRAASLVPNGPQKDHVWQRATRRIPCGLSLGSIMDSQMPVVVLTVQVLVRPQAL